MRPPKNLWFLTMLLLAGNAAAQGPIENTKDKPQEVADESADKTPAEQVQAIIAEYQAAYDAFMTAYREAEDDDSRNKAFEELYPDAADFAPGLWKIAEANKGTAAELDALVWIGQNSREPSSTDKVLEAVIASHIESEKIAPIVQSVYVQNTKTLDYLDEIFTSSPSSNVQGQACHAIATYWKGRADAGSEEALERAVEMFEVLVAEYPDVIKYGRTMKELADGELFEINNLGIGKPAPEITGMDIDGVEFKLSDYRGKVVVLDFWGDW